MKRVKPKAPGVRIDGGKRVDLKRMRERREKKRDDAQAMESTPCEDTRVKDAWDREERRAVVAKRSVVANRAVDKLRDSDGGKQGARLSSVKVKISADRSERQIMRCRPGTFEWKYGRNKQDMYFHAGNHFAMLWERAGISVASSADFLRGTASGYATGISDGRVAAMDKLTGCVKDLGHAGFERLVSYCISGLTTAEIAMRERVSQREIAIVLHHDLRQCAKTFKFIGGAHKRDHSAVEAS